MRRLIVTGLAALMLVGVAFAAPTVSDPEHTWAVVRIRPNGSETLLGAFTDANFTQEQVIRATALNAGRQNRTNNPAWHIVVYCPSNGGQYTADDICWDSLVDL